MMRSGGECRTVRRGSEMNRRRFIQGAAGLMAAASLDRLHAQDPAATFTHKTAFQGSSAALHVVERFTRVSAGTILYRFTVDDPNTWTRSWSAEIPLLATKGPLFEYACHEGNYGMPDILSGARYSEKKKD